MSLPTQREAEAFLTPLRSRSTVFILDDRATDLLFSRFLLGCLVRTRKEAIVADINAFYGSNAQRIAPESDALQNINLSLPPPGFAVEPWIVDFLIGAADPAVVILDDLNTLYHLLSFDGSKRAGNRVSFLIALTSFLARTRPQTIVSKVYARNRPIQNGRRGERSLDRLGDLGVAVKYEASELTFTCKNGGVWRGDGTFSARVNP
jgi:hypothetical protein